MWTWGLEMNQTHLNRIKRSLPWWTRSETISGFSWKMSASGRGYENTREHTHTHKENKEEEKQTKTRNCVFLVHSAAQPGYWIWGCNAKIIKLYYIIQVVWITPSIAGGLYLNFEHSIALLHTENRNEFLQYVPLRDACKHFTRGVPAQGQPFATPQGQRPAKRPRQGWTRWLLRGSNLWPVVSV